MTDHLHSKPVGEWTEAEAFAHLSETFDMTARAHQDLMEPYVVQLVETNDRAVQRSIMQEGLRATIHKRIPMRGEISA